MSNCRCNCGLINLNIVAPTEIARCHCSICKNIHGKSPSLFASYNKSMIMNQINEFDIKTYESSNFAHRGFCVRCNTPIYMLYNGSAKIWIYSNVFKFDILNIDQYDIHKTSN
jgi:hypothetical protein